VIDPSSTTWTIGHTTHIRVDCPCGHIVTRQYTQDELADMPAQWRVGQCPSCGRTFYTDHGTILSEEEE
jgi:hypothetical protein